jgi:hypothetical protein
MARKLPPLTVLTALISGSAFAADPPKIDALDLQGEKPVCMAWAADPAPATLPPADLVWAGLPAAVKPFGMRAYASIDGMIRPLRQIAYAKTDGVLSIHYRTLGDRAYDVRLDLTGLAPEGVEGDGLAGSLTVSRFGLFTELNVAGSCKSR